MSKKNTFSLIKHGHSIHDIIAVYYNLKVVFIEGDTMTSSVYFIESDCSRSNWTI